MTTLRTENFRNGEWTLRGEGEMPAGTTAEQIAAATERLALNHPARALVDGVVVCEFAKLSRKRGKQVFGL